jgi:hypothetical protein
MLLIKGRKEWKGKEAASLEVVGLNPGPLIG